MGGLRRQRPGGDDGMLEAALLAVALDLDGVGVEELAPVPDEVHLAPLTS